MGKAIIFRLLTAAAILLLIVIYFSPIWWVKLDAPAYPKGVPINFHVNGVFNGRQVEEGEFCDKVMFHVLEMDVLNHFVGMYPIATGGPIERGLSQFLFAFLITLLVAFMVSGPKLQASALSVGFGIILVWAYMTLFTQGSVTSTPEQHTQGGVSLMSEGYQHTLQCGMDMEPDEFQEWSGFQAMQAVLRNALYKYYSMGESAKANTERGVALLVTATYVVIGVLIATMLVFIVGLLWKNNLFYWLLVIIPILLPVFFLLEYAGWLWFFGHNLHPGGPFTIKPFMPTVLGEGLINLGNTGGRFVTYSYPNYGFGLMVLSSILLTLAGLLRRKPLRKADGR
ncbi:MAG: hypothetical protein DRR08_30525 [Candidatus Parabeggiatoa sp. nov. 2]|nr:MAG: hypothetical protein B6247_28130 [Beggiatoa sp. 4572_84]RKZ50236.1 MAG: hypothetical protein DRR08_30525 [Gammaproteobacteria bacterium]HEC85877.1 hypothetical protein [Thioploca sp.]